MSTETTGPDDAPIPDTADDRPVQAVPLEAAADRHQPTSGAMAEPDGAPAPSAPDGGGSGADPTPVAASVVAPDGTARGWRPRLVEGLAITALSWALAVLMTWPMAKTISSTVPDEPSDPIYFAWQLAWVPHALRHQPLHLWTTPAFLGAPNNLAFTDTMLGYAPLGMFLGTDRVGGIRILNVATMLSFALAFAGAYALARALGARAAGALVAGAAFAYAPWRMEQIIHLNILSTGGMALALAFLVRGHGWSLRYGLRPHTRSTGYLIAGWAVATWQITLGFGIGVVFGYVLGGTVAVLALAWISRARYRRWLTRRFVIADVLGAVAFLGVAAFLTIPYLRVIESHPEAKRDASWLPLFSPPWKGYLIAPDTNVWWGARQTDWRATLGWEHEMVVFPGLALMVLAALAVLFSAWPLRRRLGVLALTFVMGVLSMGTAFPFWEGKYTFMIAYNLLPGWDSMRTPGRLVIWVTLGMGILAAGLVSALVDRFAPLPARGVLADSPVPVAPPWRAEEAAVAAVEEARADVYGERLEAAYGSGRAGRSGGSSAFGFPLTTVLASLLGSVIAAVVVVEGVSKVQQWELYGPPVSYASVPAPIFVFPTSQVGDYDFMLWGADGWQSLANGDSGFYPEFQVELQAKTASFPDADSIAYLRAKGVKTVIVPSYEVEGTPQAQALNKPLDGLGVTRREVEEGVVYDLR
ncbi:MAG: hypothetical protein U0Q15_16585 [Kineosporiaceae bacterium]